MWTKIKNFFSKLFNAIPEAPKVEDVVAPAAPVVVTPMAEVTITASLRKGAKGENVKTLQSVLKAKGFYNSSIDGDFGPLTHTAVVNFQKANGLTQDGVVGPMTAAKLGIKIVAPEAPVTPEKPPVVESPKPTPTDGKVDLVAEYIKEASKYKYVTENKGKNRSTEIDTWNKASGVALGSAWCMAFQQAMIATIEKKYGVNSRVAQSAHCKTVWDKSPADLKDSVPQVGDLIIWNYSGTANGHVGVVIEVLKNNMVRTIEGNTGPGPEVERNGDGVYVKERSIKGSGSMKVLGFIRIWDKQFI